MSNIDQQDKEDMDAVGRAYRDARESEGMQPPPALDDAIRAAARRAVHAGPQPVGKNWLRQWTPQLAVAAVVVLSVSVVFVAVEERPDLAPASVQKVARDRATEAPVVLLPLETKIVQLPTVADLKRDALDATAKKVAADLQIAREKTATVAKQELTAPARSAPLPAQLAAGANSSAAPVYAPPAPPAAQAPSPSATPRFVPPPEVTVTVPAPFPGAMADAAAPMRKEARADAGASAKSTAEPKSLRESIAATGSVRSLDAADSPAKPASPAAMPAPVIANAAPVLQSPQAAQAPMLKQLAPTPAPAASALAAESSSRAAEVDAARKSNPSSQSIGIRGFGNDESNSANSSAVDERPGPWLKRLMELREQGKLVELREEIARFRKRHPDVVLPKSLTE